MFVKIKFKKYGKIFVIKKTNRAVFIDCYDNQRINISLLSCIKNI